MKTSEINKEANNIIKDLFFKINKDTSKEDWKKTLDFIIKKTEDLEKNCWEWKFVWRKIRQIMTTRFGQLFIIKNKNVKDL